MTLQVMFQKHLPKIIQLYEQPTDTRGKKSIKRCMGLLMGIFSGGGGRDLYTGGGRIFGGLIYSGFIFQGFTILIRTVEKYQDSYFQIFGVKFIILAFAVLKLELIGINLTDIIRGI